MGLCKRMTSPGIPELHCIYHKMNEHKRMLQFCVYMKCMIEDVRLVERASSSDVFVHELAVEF